MYYTYVHTYMYAYIYCIYSLLGLFTFVFMRMCLELIFSKLLYVGIPP